MSSNIYVQKYELKKNKGNKRHLFRKLGIYHQIGKKRQHKTVAFQSQ